MLVSYDDWVKITRLFILFKAVQFLIIYLVPAQFDTSATILVDFYVRDKSRDLLQILQFLNLNVGENFKKVLEKHILQEILDKIVVWDAVYFTKLSTQNSIEFEHEWVFSPLWWRFINFMNFSTDLKQNFYANVLVGLCISNICHYLSCIVMYILTLKTFQFSPIGYLVKSNDRYKFTLPYICAILTVIQPSGIFSTGIYSESITQLLCYSGLTLREISLSSPLSKRIKDNCTVENTQIVNKTLYMLSGIFFAIAYGFRSNAVMYGIVFLDDLYKAVVSVKNSNVVWSKVLINSFTIIIAGLALFISIIILIYLPYLQYCGSSDRGDWCDNKPLPWLVPYAQKHYWNNGFLKYFTINNIPNFLIGLPSLLIILGSLIYFKSVNPLLTTTNTSGTWKACCLYLFLQFTTLHVQIVNRVMTFIPFHIWFVGYLLTVEEEKEQEKGKWWSLGKICAHWWIIWVLIQTGLYGCALPPA